MYFKVALGLVSVVLGFKIVLKECDHSVLLDVLLNKWEGGGMECCLQDCF